MVELIVASSTRGILMKQVQAVPVAGMANRHMAAAHVDRDGEVLTVTASFDAATQFAPDVTPAVTLASATTEQLLEELRSRIEPDRDYDDPSEYDD